MSVQNSRAVGRHRTKSRTILVKTFDYCSETRVDMADGMPLTATSLFDYTNMEEYNVNLDTGSFVDCDNIPSGSKRVWSYLKDDPFFKHMLLSHDNAEVIPLSQQFDYVAGQSFNRGDLNSAALSDLSNSEDRTLEARLSRQDVLSELSSVAVSMFDAVNPITKDKDVKSGDFYTPYIPLVVMSDVLPPQTDSSGVSYFNPEGQVSVMEFLDSLNAIKSHSNANESRHLSIDNVSNEKDFFNEGYLSCLSKGRSSLFYELYKRRELIKPITRLELAYITVLCWRDFTLKYDSVNGGRFVLGINADWSKPARYLKKFEDGLKYRVYKKTYRIFDSDDTAQGTVVDLRAYKESLTVSDFINEMRQGRKGIPLPLIMCLVELDVLDLFYFKDMLLSPLSEVTRGELSYFLVKLAKTFPMKFISRGDNTYYTGT